MKQTGTKLMMLILVSMIVFNAFGTSPKWMIASQAYTFKEFTLSEALEKMESLDIKFVELYPGQLMGPADKRTTNFTMDAQQIDDLKALLKKHDIEVISYGVISPKKKEEWQALFAFAKTMGIKTIVSEPLQSQLELVDGLCQKYNIRVAIHNHPIPSPYWDPAIVLDALKGRSKYMGACPDLGHWTRSGLDATTCLKMLQGRIFEIHMKDVNKTDKSGHAVVWGEGVIDWQRVAAELKRQNFSGMFVIEHEYNWTDPMPDLKKNLAFFETIK